MIKSRRFLQCVRFINNQRKGYTDELFDAHSSSHTPRSVGFISSSRLCILGAKRNGEAWGIPIVRIIFIGANANYIVYEVSSVIKYPRA